MKLLLTGQLPFILLLATLLALPISFGLLHLYRRAVVRSMRASGSSSGIAPDPSRQTPPPEDRSDVRPTAASLETALVRGPWHTAGIYAIAGLAYAAVIVTGVLLSGPDLATTTVEPHEFLDFVRGRLARRFIDGDATFARRLTEMDQAPDRDARYRVNDFFCFDNAWRTVVSHLARSSDAVLVDLRGFGRQNSGVVFEFTTLVDVVRLERVVMAIDDTTDEAFLQETIERARGQMSAQSPNRSVADARPSMVRLRDRRLRELPLVLSALSRAAHA